MKEIDFLLSKARMWNMIILLRKIMNEKHLRSMHKGKRWYDDYFPLYWKFDPRGKQ